MADGNRFDRERRLDGEVLPFALELATFGPFLAEELFLGMEHEPTDADRSSWVASAVRRHLIVAVDPRREVAPSYAVDRPKCERRLRGLRRGS